MLVNLWFLLRCFLASIEDTVHKQAGSVQFGFFPLLILEADLNKK